MRKFFVIFLLPLLFFSCRKTLYNSKDSNTLNVALTSHIDSFDPSSTYDTVSATVMDQAYETLYEYHYLKRPYSLIPLLADEMPKIENGNTKYTIKIKKNIRYHDNLAFNNQPRFVKAQDFINQFKRLAFVPTQSVGWWLFDKKIKGLNKFRKDAGNSLDKFFSLEVSGLKAFDDYTLIIELNEPQPQFLYTLAMSFTSPIPEEAIRYYNNSFHQQIIGTGPFKLTETIKEKNIRLEKFEHYRTALYPTEGDRKSYELNLLKDAGKKIPFLDAINFYVMPETEGRWNSFLDKKIDYMILPQDYYDNAINSRGELSPNLTSKNISLQLSPALTYWWLSFNMQDPIWGKNKKLRKAIAHAIDINKYIRVFSGIGLKANSIYPPGVVGYSPTRELPYSYDINKAKEYLSEAGYPEGKNLPPITFELRGENQTAVNHAQFITDELKKINVKVNAKLNSFPDFLKKFYAGKLQFWKDGWNLDYPDAENVLQLLITKNHPPGPNVTFYSNKKIDELFTQINDTNDQETRVKILHRMEDIILDDLPWIMLFYSRDYYLFHNELKNFRQSGIVSNSMKYLRLERQ